jgi:hypothetical protein
VAKPEPDGSTKSSAEAVFDSSERRSWLLRGASAAFASGLAAPGASIASARLPSVAAPVADSGFVFLLEMAECETDADSAAMALSELLTGLPVSFRSVSEPTCATLPPLWEPV